MEQFIYKRKEPGLLHAYYDLSKRSNRYKNEDAPEKSTSRMTTYFRRPPGGYKSKYYDPQARHERYLKEKAAKKNTSGSKGSGRGSGSKSSGRGSGSKGSGRGSGRDVSDAISKLAEESALDTEAHKEEARRRIEELRKQLKEHVDKLQGSREDEESGVNVAEVRGKIQSIKDQIESTGQDLQLWISNEREALQRRIAKLTGKNYDKEKVEQQTAAKNREKEINSRADALYKSRNKK